MAGVYAARQAGSGALPAAAAPRARPPRSAASTASASRVRWPRKGLAFELRQKACRFSARVASPAAAREHAPPAGCCGLRRCGGCLLAPCLAAA
eukprot:6633792-Prymnesium_polylepis.1